MRDPLPYPSHDEQRALTEHLPEWRSLSASTLDGIRAHARRHLEHHTAATLSTAIAFAVACWRNDCEAARRAVSHRTGATRRG